GPSGEIIMDYSIYAAKDAGFDKVVFITRRDLEKDFREIIGNRIEKYIDVEYVFQEMDNIPAGFSVPEGRKKPWGTGQAVLSCLGTLDCPFVVINADDFYGKEAFRATHEYLVNLPEGSKGRYCMAGFVLGNTLSEHGQVTRGVCEVEDGHLTTVVERFALRREGDVVKGEDSEGNEMAFAPDVPVSMNMWGFTPDFLDELQDKFTEFLATEAKTNPLKSEYLLPQVVGEMVRAGRAEVAVLPTADRWFGVTYKEDKPLFVASITKLIEEGEFPESVFP
ncbi:MAG: nucleotidyltransferase, partial [Lachnospiraceae bacterium]|nr:nucleotidyltransferase [Lachnospiraceae bacterium]